MARTPERFTSDHGARLHFDQRPPSPRAVVLVLHGGQAHGTEPTSWRQPSVLRVRPVARAVARRGRDDLAVAFLRYAVRGWNGHGDPLRDARWALGHLRHTYPSLPLGLVGYSMGGRVALALAGECHAQALVTLAAWVEPPELATWQPCPDLQALLMHGSEDRVTDPEGSVQAAAALRAGGATAEVDLVAGESHALLRRPLYWHSRTATFMHNALVRE